MWNVLYYDSLDSTNTFAWELLQQGSLRHGDVIQAGHQTGGRGRFNNRSWADEPNCSLLMSVVLTEIKPNLLPLLSFVAGLAALRAMRRDQSSSNGDRIKLKWPNDVLIDRKKVAGILIENCWNGTELKGCVVGVGINVNQKTFEGELSERATSIRQEFMKELSISDLRDHILAELKSLLQLDRNALTTQIRRELEWMSGIKGLTVQLLEGLEYRNAQYKGVSDDGALLVQHEDRTHTIYAATLAMPRS
jgi:BirA family transcriptional regulator, biotin operon repressor / biotin---[acetyl-CoA-carboxylase] ligase